ncbi:MAG: lipoprotein [Burkholderiaceae bacterium]
MRPRRTTLGAWVSWALLAFALTGCGQKGPLKLPPSAAQSASAAASSP